jgi:glycosyltransferase involved in cell wall biosynthesis
VVTFHDLTFFFFPQLHTRAKRLFFPLAMRLSARRANALLADSESTRRDAMRVLKISPERIFTAPLGISERYRPVDDPQALEQVRQRYRLPERFILFVGLVEPRKNLPLLIQAYAGLCQGGSCPPLVIVGRFGWMYEEVLRQVDALGLKDRVQFTGYIPSDDLPMVYNLATVFVYPSLYEGFGFPPLEAMACGVPVVTTGISSMLDNIGDAGLLTAPGDAAALHSAMRRLLDDPGLRQEYSQRGRRRAAEFTWKRTAQETLKAYQYAAANERTQTPRLK